MAPDPEYLAKVSSALVDAVGEAQKLVDARVKGQALLDVVRHARDLHEILVEELARGPGATDATEELMLREMDERLRSLEAELRPH